MISKNVTLQYLENGIPTNAYSVLLASEFMPYFGIKNANDGTILVDTNTAVTNTSTGNYSYTASFDEGATYIVSWQVQSTSEDIYKYVVQTVGPFNDDSVVIASTGSRGRFLQCSDAAFFFQVTNRNGSPLDPDSIAATITDSTDTVIVDSVPPERISTGYFALDWQIPATQTVGDYTITWSYTALGQSFIATESFVIFAPQGNISNFNQNLYSRRLIEFRVSLDLMLWQAQHVTIRNEQLQPSSDLTTYNCTFHNINLGSIRVYRNNILLTGGFSVNCMTGTIVFDIPNLSVDTVTVDYNFRLIADENYDRYLSNAIGVLNVYPVYTSWSLFMMDNNWIPAVLYGAVVDALRELILSLNFEDKSLIFGGPDGAQKAIANFESLKKNYEDTWNKLLEQKKLGPYPRTRFMATSEFTLPGGRSRWFRSLFK